MDNMSDFPSWLIDKNISYVQVDVYERTQPEWMMEKIPPYRLTRTTTRDLRARRINASEAFSRFEDAPKYLEPVQSFGRTRTPLTRDRPQPQAIVYRVNRSALP